MEEVVTAPTPPADPAGQPTDPAGDPPKQDPKPAPPKDPKAGDPPKDPKPDAPLGEAGMKALQAERDARKELETRLKSLEPLQKLAEALGGGEPGKADPVAELEKRLSTHEQQIEEERSARFRAEVAHEKQLTPQQAERLRGSTRDELIADADALLAAFPSEPKKFQGSGDGGARPNGTGPSQLTRDDLKRMGPDEIVKAKSEGRLNDVLGYST